MYLNPILAALVGMSCLLMLRQAVGRGRNIQWGWGCLAVAHLALIAVGYWQWRNNYGVIVVVPWLVLMMVPFVLRRLAMGFVFRYQYAPAIALHTIAAVLHPFDNWRFYPRLLRAASLVTQGRYVRARVIYDSVASKRSRLAPSAMASLLLIDRRWHDMVDWINATMDDNDLAAHPDIATIYLRSLAESGDTPAMLAMCTALLPDIDSPAFMYHAWFIGLTAMAFTGRIQEVRALLAGPLKHMPTLYKDHWLATTHTALGEMTTAKTLLEPQLADAAVPELRQAAIERLQTPPFPAANLDEPSRQYLQNIQRDLIRRLSDEGYIGRKRCKPWGTHALVAANLIAFAIEVWRGGMALLLGKEEGAAVLPRLGALLPPSETHGEYWRMLSANFLHFGWLHVSMNMLALWLLGPFVERRTGWWRYLLIYLTAGVCAVGGCWLLQYYHLIRSESLVGASGAIMGLIGATGAIELKRHLKERATHSRQRVYRIVFIVLLQTCFDQVSPQISSSAHLIGCAAGFLITMLICQVHKPTDAQDVLEQIPLPPSPDKS